MNEQIDSRSYVSGLMRVETGIHIGFILSALAVFMHLLSDTPLYFLHGYEIVPFAFSIPPVIAVEIAYLSVSLAARRPIHLILPVLELVVTASSIILWWRLVRFHSSLLPAKTLSNVSATMALAYFGSMFYAMRCYYAFIGDFRKNKYFKWACCAVMHILATASAFLVPGFGE